MASNSPPFMPPKFVDTVPKGLWNIYNGPREDGPGPFLNPANTGTPVIYAGTVQTSVIVNAKPKPPRQTHPAAAGTDSKIK
jgi:hypothetical protein